MKEKVEEIKIKGFTELSVEERRILLNFLLNKEETEKTDEKGLCAVRNDDAGENEDVQDKEFGKTVDIMPYESLNTDQCNDDSEGESVSKDREFQEDISSEPEEVKIDNDENIGKI